MQGGGGAPRILFASLLEIDRIKTGVPLIIRRLASCYPGDSPPRQSSCDNSHDTQHDCVEKRFIYKYLPTLSHNMYNDQATRSQVVRHRVLYRT